jgi:predicted kinase
MSGSGGKPVLILSGAPGVGKTTAAAVLAEGGERGEGGKRGEGDEGGEGGERAVHLESDRFYRFIRAGYIEPWKPESNEQNRAIAAIVAEAAAGYAAAGYFTILDGIVIPGWYLEPMRDALHERGHEVAYAVLRAPLPVCVERVSQREGGSLFDAEAMDRLWKAFTGLGELEANVVEVEGMGPEEVAATLRDRLERGLLRV